MSSCQSLEVLKPIAAVGSPSPEAVEQLDKAGGLCSN